MTDRESHRAAVEAGYASVAGYVEKWGTDMKYAIVPVENLETDVLAASPNGGKVSRAQFSQTLEKAVSGLGKVGAVSLGDFALAVIEALGLEVSDE